MRYYIGAIKNSFNFNGRANRSEYWFFILFDAIVKIFLFFIGGFIPFLLPVFSTYLVASGIPLFSLQLRRLNDIGKSRWKILLILVPIVGQILLVIDMCKKGIYEYSLIDETKIPIKTS